MLLLDFRLSPYPDAVALHPWAEQNALSLKAASRDRHQPRAAHLMLIEIDRSMSEFDRVGSAIDFRDLFRSRAGGFAPPTPSLFATAIASMIANAGSPRPSKQACGVRCERRRPIRRPDRQCEMGQSVRMCQCTLKPLLRKNHVRGAATPNCFSNGRSFSRSFLPVSTLLAVLVY